MFGTTRYESKPGVVALTIARVTVGVILTAHGWIKLTGFAQWHGQVRSLGLPAPDVSAWLGVAGELLGGLGLIVGLLTPIAAFGALCNMLVAITVVHWQHGLFAKDGGFEFPLALAVTALFFMLRGPGPMSLDALLARRATARSTR